MILIWMGWKQELALMLIALGLIGAGMVHGWMNPVMVPPGCVCEEVD